MAFKYPSHFIEPIRQEIAISQIQHDLRKLFPSLDLKNWQKIDQDIANWPKGKQFEITPIHDFWNFFWGFSRGLKLKSLINWITAENITWSKEEVLIDNVLITFDFPGLECVGKAPFLAKKAKQILQKSENEKHRQEMLNDSNYRSKKFADRDQFPIIIIFDNKGRILEGLPGYYDYEGNRRLVRAILQNEKTISAFVGRFINPKDKWPKNYWINTGMLRDLVYLAKGYEISDDKYSFNQVRKFYQILLQDFQNTQTNTIFYVFNYLERSDKFLIDLLTKELENENRRNEPSTKEDNL